MNNGKEGKANCRRCGYLTANLRKVCRKCLGSLLDTKPKGTDVRNEQQYKQEEIERVKTCYDIARQKRPKTPVREVAKMLAIPAWRVHDILSIIREQRELADAEVYQTEYYARQQAEHNNAVQASLVNAYNPAAEGYTGHTSNRDRPILPGERQESA